MSSDDVVLSVRDVAKVYRVYSRPHHRLLQAIDDRRGRGTAHCFEVPAVAGVSFDLVRGDGISIIGRNGSGKSTLLEMLAGTLLPTRGEIHRVGRVSALLELGAGFNPDFTGRQNFRMSAAIQGLTERQIDEIEDEVEAFAEIGPFIDEPVRTYSSGMYVRLAFAAAVHVFPDLLIVDEALAVGDIFFQQKCFEFIDKRLAGTAKVIVTHDLASAVRLSSRCLVMDRGEVVFDGEPLQAVEAYTAINLRERSTRTGSAAASTAPAGEPAAEPEAVEALLDGEALEVETDRSTAPGALTVHRISVSRRDGSTWTALDPEGPIVHPGDRLRLQVDVSLHVPIDEPVWGYLMRDRVGNALFGQNTVGSELPVEPAKPGRQLVEMELDWPEVEQGDYTLTVGLGDGQHPLHHSIVAWAQGLVRFICIPHRAVHGAFNNDLRSFAIRRAGNQPSG